MAPEPLLCYGAVCEMQKPYNMDISPFFHYNVCNTAKKQVVERYGITWKLYCRT